MGNAKIVLLCTEKDDIEFLIREIKKHIAKGTHWVDGPYLTDRGAKAYITFEVVKDES